MRRQVDSKKMNNKLQIMSEVSSFVKLIGKYIRFIKNE